MRIPFTSRNISVNSILRVFNWLAVIAYAIGAAIHERFPEAIAWLNPEVKTAVVLAVFALLADRILRVHMIVCEPPLKVYATREAAYGELADLVRKYPAKRVDLIQFSGQTALQLIRTIAVLERPVHVRLFLAHPEQAGKFDPDAPGAFHVDRINDTLLKASIVQQEHPTCTLNAYYYSSPAGPSVVVIDDWLSSVGWYHCFQDVTRREIVRVRGHAAPAVNVMDSHNPLTHFAEEQIHKIEKTAIAVPLPAVPAIGPGQSGT